MPGRAIATARALAVSRRARSGGHNATNRIFWGAGGVAADMYFNVKDHGAAGDGSTNDTTAILNTISAAHSAGGGVVYFPAGVYMETGVKCIYGDIAVRGDGIGISILRLIAASNQAALLFASGSGTIQNVGVFDLELDCNGSNQTAHIPNPSALAFSGDAATQSGVYGLAFRDVYGITLDDVYVHDSINTGIQLNQIGDVAVGDGVRVARCGKIRSLQDNNYAEPANGISVIHAPSDSSLPGRGIRIGQVYVTETTDVALDLHGIAAENINVIGFMAHGQLAATSPGAAHYGIGCEEESGDPSAVGWINIEAPMVSDLSYGVNMVSTANTFLHNTINVRGGTFRNCSVGINPAGTNIGLCGNQFDGCDTPISTNNNNVSTVTHSNWTICCNHGPIGSTGFGDQLIQIRTQSGVAYHNINIIGNQCVGNSNGRGDHALVHLDAGLGGSIDVVNIVGNMADNVTAVNVTGSGTVTNVTTSANVLS